MDEIQYKSVGLLLGEHNFIDKNLSTIRLDKNLCAMWPCRRPAYVIVSLRFNQSACCSGRSTNSHSERPLHLWHRGKLASLSSATSSPQHSEAYSPGSMTSCPVFISLPCRGLSYMLAH